MLKIVNVYVPAFVDEFVRWYTEEVVIPVVVVLEDENYYDWDA